MGRLGSFHRICFIAVSCIALLLSLSFSASALIEAPHNRDNKISCGNCHGKQLGNSPFWGQGVGGNPFNAFCYAACHNTGVGRFSAAGAPMVKTHSSATTNSSRGTWEYQCIDCHQPHSHQQNNWEARNKAAASLYLATGSLASVPAPVYDPDAETTTFTIASITMNNGWTIDGLKNKSDLFRGTIFIPVEMLPNYNYAIYDLTASTVTLHGDLRSAPWVSFLAVYKFKIIYGQYIRSTIDINKTPKDMSDDRQVKFYDRTGPYSFAHNDMLGGDIDTDGNPDDSTVTGICQVCHTRTDHWRNDGTLAAMAGSVHENTNGTDCTDCHWHSQGFKHGGDGTGAECAACHNSGQHQVHLMGFAYCSYCHDLSDMPKMADGNNLANTTACAACHRNPSTGGLAKVPGYKDGWPGGLDLNCAGCHDGRPTDDVLDDVYTHDPASTCTDCHRGHAEACHPGQHTSIDDGDETLDCGSCHFTGDGLAVTPELQRPPVGMQSLGHKRLVSTRWIRQYDCYYCHSDSVDQAWNLKASHANGSVNVVIDAQWAIGGKPAPTYAGGVCYNTYCHSDGTTVNPEIREYDWAEGHKGCNACHGHNPADAQCSNCHTDGRSWSDEELWLSAMPMYPSGGKGDDRANTHFRHLFTGLSCDDCHQDTVVGACIDCHHRAYDPSMLCLDCHSHTPATEAAIGIQVCIDCHHAGEPGKATCGDCHNGVPTTGGMSEANHINPAFHVNTKKNVTFSKGGEYNSVTKTCSSTFCHELGEPPVWGGSVSGSVTCANCHRTAGPDEDNFGGFDDTPARINYEEWITVGHGRPAADGPYPKTDNPAANFPSNGCWYCHDNTVLHNTEDNPFRLRKHSHFYQRFEKECVYCHMSEDPVLAGQLDEDQCVTCHNSSGFTLAPQLSDIPAVTEGIPNDPYPILQPDHGEAPIITQAQRCDSANCHSNDARRHKVDSDQIWTAADKADVQNQYVMMGVCLKCHDDDSGGQCETCHAWVDNPLTSSTNEATLYRPGFDPKMPGLGFKAPAKAKASSFHFGYKHYLAYEKSVQADPDNPVWKGGKFCWDCHDPHGDRNYQGNFNIYMIQGKVATQTDGVYGKPVPDKRRDVVFTAKVNGRSYARKDPPYDGICNVCHDDNLANPDRARHYNRSTGDTHNASRICTSCHEHRFTDSHASGAQCNECHQSKPVPRHTAFGQPRDCTKCHDGVINGRMNIMKQLTQSQSHHVQRADGTVSNKDCYACHWEATEFGLINVEHHEGFNHKTHTGTGNAKVDLVIWNEEDSPGSGVNEKPHVGSRPDIYDLDGSNPAGPGVPTATTFLASDLNFGDPDPAVNLAKERAQVEKVTPHCLGCHSSQCNENEPFNDCKNPIQYSWDGSSIGDRYGVTGTTTWGKYTGSPGAAPKNLQKAFSAHGNAVNNEGGFDLVNGVDGAITSTRDNSKSLDGNGHNVQCFDCHSSHGSFVSGITSSYTSFDGDKHGANLKETQAGYGGYVNNYQAAAYPDPSAVNYYNAGAGQCFDCHQTANAGQTTTGSYKAPWGYKSTFGADKPIIGYKDNPNFVGTYPGRTESAALAGRPAADSTIDLTYRLNRSTMGGHLNASHNLAPGDPLRPGGYDDTSMNTNVYGSINGLCTPCHDPHGISPTLGANTQYGVPLLKGTWLTSPFKEDVTVPDPYGNKVTNFGDGTPQSWGRGGSHPSPYQPENLRINIDRTTLGGSNRIVETDRQFAGLCLNCHPRSNPDESPNLEDGQVKNTAFRTVDRIHESVKGWGANTEHSYPCSKCHQPHASGLPRLLQTNCLNFQHRGGKLTGGEPWKADSESGSAHGHSEHRGYPIANSLGNSSANEAGTACHSQAPANPGLDWKDKQLWNNVSPWPSP